MKPLIGVPLRSWEDNEGFSLFYMYEKARRGIIKSGGLVLAITPTQDIDYYKTKGDDFPELTEEDHQLMEEYLNVIDGLFLPGGNKFCEYDRELLRKAIEKRIPILGVCLGMQLMGSYESDIKLDSNGELKHNQEKDDKYLHYVNIDKDSKLYQIIGKEKIHVNSLHNYHLREDNPIYRTVAYSEDGLIEAIEYPSGTFNIGVQWHPESMVEYDEDAFKLMNTFINAAKQRQTEKIGKQEVDLSM